MKKNVLITICGRAGSKGCKNKNIKDFLGKPLVYYTLSAAFLFIDQVKDIATVDVCLNTDSEDLKEIVLSKYPEVHYIAREKSLGEDSVPKAAVWHNSVDIMSERLNRTYDYIIDLDITSPLRRSNDIYNAFKKKLERVDADMVESVCHCRRNPYFNMYKEDGEYVSTVIDAGLTTRQSAPNVYDENASIYVLDAKFFHDNDKNMLNEAKTVVYIMKDTAVLDIDSEEDFELMGVVAAYLYENDEQFKIIQQSIR